MLISQCRHCGFRSLISLAIDGHLQPGRNCSSPCWAGILIESNGIRFLTQTPHRRHRHQRHRQTTRPGTITRLSFSALNDDGRSVSRFAVHYLISVAQNWLSSLLPACIDRQHQELQEEEVVMKISTKIIRVADTTVFRVHWHVLGGEVILLCGDRSDAFVLFCWTPVDTIL